MRDDSHGEQCTRGTWGAMGCLLWWFGGALNWVGPEEGIIPLIPPTTFSSNQSGYPSRLSCSQVLVHSLLYMVLLELFLLILISSPIGMFLVTWRGWQDVANSVGWNGFAIARDGNALLVITC